MSLPSHIAARQEAFAVVRAVFNADPAAAFAHFAPCFDEEHLSRPGGEATPQRVLEMFAPWAFTREGPEWREPRAPAWLREDGRWIALFVRLRRHPLLGRDARNVLRHADRGQVERALADALQTEVPEAIHRRSERDGTLLERYRDGEYADVWAELRSHRTIAGAFRDEALDVARETMRRVLHNTELLCARLDSAEWVPLRGALRTPPRAEDVDILRKLESTTGAPLPPSLRAFWEVVGGIDLVWNYQLDLLPPDLGVELDLAGLDPLAVDSPAVVEWIFEEWADSHGDIPAEIAGPYRLHLAPDYLHKADISGGEAYGVELPFLGADPPFLNEAHGLPFVDYLRLCFRWGGFPQLEQHAGARGVAAFVQRMTEGFEPF